MVQDNRRGRISPELLKQLKEQQERKKKENKIYWWTIVSAIGFVVGAVLISMMLLYTMISYLYLALGIMAIALLAAVLQWRAFYRPAFIEKNKKLSVFSYLSYCLFGNAIPLSGILLLINFLGVSHITDIEKHRVLGFDHAYIIDSNFLTVLRLEDDAYKNDPGMRSIEYTEAIKWRKMPFFAIRSSKGLLGIPIYKGVTMLPDPEHPYDDSHGEVIEGLYQVTRPDTAEVYNPTDTLSGE